MAISVYVLHMVFNFSYIQITCKMYLHIIVFMGYTGYCVCTQTEAIEHNDTRLEISSDD